MPILDLSVVLDELTPIYPGDPPTKIAPAARLEQDGYSDSYISLGTHVGTHVDAPVHMLASGRTLDTFPIEQFVGKGCYIDVTDQVIDLASVKKADVEEGDIVLFHTGMSDRYHEQAYYDDYPAIPADVAEYLVKQKVKMVGVDMCSVDHEPFPVHKILLESNVLIIENLANLASLANQKFTVYALPVRLDIDAAPARVIAQIEDKT